MPSNEFKCNPEATFKVDASRFAFSPRKLRIVCIGAGYSGLSLAYKLQHERPLDYVDWVIYEKNPEVGGTWWENNYPGVGCDIPAHTYVFPFEPNPTWSKYYAGGEEIKQYMINTAQKYDLKRNVVFNTRLVKAVWNEEQAKWTLDLQSGDSIRQDKADVLVDAKGILNNWKWPDIPGFHSFKGKILHTANWDPEYDWGGKKIAVIGNGSSGIQVVPALQQRAGKLVNYIRHPTWVSMNLCGDLTRDGMGTNFEFTPEEKEKFQKNPDEFLEYRKAVERSVNSVYRIMISGSEENAMVFNLVNESMRQRLNNDPDLIKQFIPDYEIGCRRLSPGDGYLEALQADNARPCFDKIKQITASGISTEPDDGAEEFDLIVCATGFENTFIPPFELVGRQNRRLENEWKETPEAYFSVCAAAMPNYFMFSGPNCPIGHGSLPQIFAWMADYILDWVEKMATEDIKSIAVKDSVVREYNIYAQENLKRCVWSKGCHAWYSKRNGDGQSNTVTAMYPGSGLQFKASLQTIRGEHFDIRYQHGNMFSYLANGEMAFERAEDGDMAYYLV